MYRNLHRATATIMPGVNITLFHLAYTPSHPSYQFKKMFYWIRHASDINNVPYLNLHRSLVVFLRWLWGSVDVVLTGGTRSYQW